MRSIIRPGAATPTTVEGPFHVPTPLVADGGNMAEGCPALNAPANSHEIKIDSKKRGSWARTTIADRWLCDRFKLTPNSKRCAICMAPRTFDKQAFLLPPATRMLLATRRNPAAGHGRQLISTPSILFTQTRIKHVETDDLPQGRFGRPHGRAHLFWARHRAT
jgi:hypothetical protein